MDCELPEGLENTVVPLWVFTHWPRRLPYSHCQGCIEYFTIRVYSILDNITRTRSQRGAVTPQDAEANLHVCCPFFHPPVQTTLRFPVFQLQSERPRRVWLLRTWLIHHGEEQLPESPAPFKSLLFLGGFSTFNQCG